MHTEIHIIMHCIQKREMEDKMISVIKYEAHTALFKDPVRTAQ